MSKYDSGGVYLLMRAFPVPFRPPLVNTTRLKNHSVLWPAKGNGDIRARSFWQMYELMQTLFSRHIILYFNTFSGIWNKWAARHWMDKLFLWRSWYRRRKYFVRKWKYRPMVCCWNRNGSSSNLPVTIICPHIWFWGCLWWDHYRVLCCSTWLN